MTATIHIDVSQTRTLRFAWMGQTLSIDAKGLTPTFIEELAKRWNDGATGTVGDLREQLDKERKESEHWEKAYKLAFEQAFENGGKANEFREQRNDFVQWRSAVCDACAVNQIDYNINDAHATLSALLRHEVSRALDPKVSKKAQELVDTGRRLEANHPAPKRSDELTFGELRRANLKRLPQFKNKHGNLAHSKPDGSDWIPAQWLQAIIGELGEYANLRKKHERGDVDAATFLAEAAKELADVVTYIDILASQFGIDLGHAVVDKFNEVSERVGADVRLANRRPAARQWVSTNPPLATNIPWATAFVIQDGSDPFHPRFWSAEHLWTYDDDQACQFRRREDAERVIHYSLCKGYGRVVQRVFAR